MLFLWLFRGEKRVVRSPPCLCNQKGSQGHEGFKLNAFTGIAFPWKLGPRPWDCSPRHSAYRGSCASLWKKSSDVGDNLVFPLRSTVARHMFSELHFSDLQREVGGDLHLKLNEGLRLIANNTMRVPCVQLDVGIVDIARSFLARCRVQNWNISVITYSSHEP